MDWLKQCRDVPPCVQTDSFVCMRTPCYAGIPTIQLEGPSCERIVTGTNLDRCARACLRCQLPQGVPCGFQRLEWSRDRMPAVGITALVVVGI